MMTAPLMYLCAHCESPFWPTVPSQTYCADACRQAASNKRNNPARAETGVRRKENFVGYDGEGIEDSYTLLANSNGAYIEDYKRGLGSRDCFDFLLDTLDNKAINVIYAGGYDVNMMLRDVPLVGKEHSCEELYKNGYTRWKGFRIHYIPRKTFTVSRRGRSFHMFDVFGFFQTSFISALKQWNLEVPEEIVEGKLGRVDFSTWEPEKIRYYNNQEVLLLVQLMEAYREKHRSAGLPDLRRWDGAGAVAASWLQREGALAFMPRTEVAQAHDIRARYAYFGGRIEMGAWGKAARIYHYDINSAYPAGMTRVPDMSQMSFEHSESPDLPDDDFSLVHVRWNVKLSPYGYGPLPWRDRHGTIIYPRLGEGWYWNVEVKSALRRFPQGIQIVESYAPHNDGGKALVYPFAESILHDYTTRAGWKRDGDAAHIPLKLALNSLYGKTAQKAGHQGNVPRYRNLFWAGFITAFTRAKINDALLLAGDRVVLTMTDSVFSLVPLDLPLSDKLGEWGIEEEDRTIDVLGAGIYRLGDGQGKFKPIKERGFGGVDIPFDQILDDWYAGRSGGTDAKGKPTGFEVRTRRFVGMGVAVASRNVYRPNWRNFVEIKKHIRPVPFVGSTKRQPDVMGVHVEGGLHFQKPKEPETAGQLTLFGSSYPMSFPYDAKHIEAAQDEEVQMEREFEREF
ncbi:MAG: DNA polymerase [Acidobacteriaceae bacterium]